MMNNLIQAWKERPLLRSASLAFILWGITALLLLPNLGYPRAVVFDETYMIPRAQRYQRGTFFQEPHPPLGRLAIFWGQQLLHPDHIYEGFALDETIQRPWPADEDITGYRIFPALFGTTIPVLVFLILQLILSEELLAFVLGLIVAFENALLTQAHFAMSDSILISFCLLSILIFVHLFKDEAKPIQKLWIPWILWGFATAGATLVKFTAGFILILVILYAIKLFSQKGKRIALTFSGIFGVTFIFTTVFVWQIHFSLLPNLDSNNDYGISSLHRQILEGKYQPNPFTRFVIQFTDAMIFIPKYHEGVPALDPTNPDAIGSPWYQWPLGGRTIPYRWETPDRKTYQYIYLIGNPVAWLISLLGVILGTSITIFDLVFRRLKQHKWIYIFALLYWTYMIPMMFIHRVMYLYHYLPPLLVGILLFGVILNEVTLFSSQTKYKVMFATLALVLVSFWVYKPFTFYEPLTVTQFQQRNIWPLWGLHWIGKNGNQSSGE